jgi:two-component system, chemotaxis family, chemotaxis protein CheY
MPRILVIDDSSTILRLTKSTLEAAGYEVITSTNPISTASFLRQHSPDLVLLDVEMPALQGTDVLKILRRYGCSPAAGIVLFSSLPESTLAELAETYDATGYIHKGRDLEPHKLVRQVRKFIFDARDRAARSCLVADDSSTMRHILAGILEKDGFQVTQVARADEALEQMKKAPGINLVLADLNMPGMDGVELVHELRGLRKEGLKILVVTSEADVTRIQAVLAAGADDCLTKPFTPDALVEKLRSLGL